MDGSSLAPIVIPVVVMIGLAIWLIMVYYAAAHPGWHGHNAAGQPKLSRGPGSREVAWGADSPAGAAPGSAGLGGAILSGLAGDPGEHRHAAGGPDSRAGATESPPRRVNP
jgi:hypothetical protein